MKTSGIGGQAVIEGVMMKNKANYAIAVRKPNNDIIVIRDSYHSKVETVTFFRLPIIRGIFAFIESMVVGMKTLSFSASFYEEEEEKPTKVENALNKMFLTKAESVIMGLTIAFATIAAIAIFIMLPFFISEILRGQIISNSIRALIEGVIRIGIFVIYVAAISQMEDIKRVFMYHGAEHKTINCIENGLELTVSNVRKQSKQHRRCGTSFMLVVMLISIIFFIFINVDNMWIRMLVRLLLIPVIAGIAYEFIKLAGRSDSFIIKILSKPGMLLQGLTTREPDDAMIEVAIQSVEAVFDWRAFLGVDQVDKEENSKEAKRSSKDVYEDQFDFLSPEDMFMVRDAMSFTRVEAEPEIESEPQVEYEPKIQPEPKMESKFEIELESQEETTPTIEPWFVEEPTPKVEPGYVEEPTSTEEPWFVEELISNNMPWYAEESTSTVEPIHTEESAPIEEPRYVEEPIPTVKFSYTEEPVHTEEPRYVEEPIPTVKFDYTEERRYVEEPIPTEEPTTVEEPLPVIDPIIIDGMNPKIRPVSKKEGNDFVRHLAGLDKVEEEEEDDEVLKALDMFFNYGKDE